VIASTADGVDLWFEAGGEGPPLLLIPGRGDSSDLYPRQFTSLLIDGGCRVIRYDPRDTGLSGDGGDTYTLTDMADDALAVLDAARVDSAHVIGLSMGGLVLSDLASRPTSRVLSATFLAAMSPDPDAGTGDDFFAALDGGNPIDLEVDAMGETTDADRAWVEAKLGCDAARAPARPEAGHRHMAAALRFGWPDLSCLSDIAASALVVHGAVDRVLPVAHAHALAAGIARAKLVILPGMGHLPRPGDWDAIAELVVDHVRSTA
jgi:3-oxoadipate enol-lactonase